MNSNYYAVIMAGGSGTRLWPLSRQERPKQTLSIGGSSSLFQLAVKRLQGLLDYDHIFVVTVAEQAKLFQIQVPEIPIDNYVIEPMPRGTASAIGLATVAIRSQAPQATIAILTADHFIGNNNRFHKFLQAAFLVAQQGRLVTLGVKPVFPSTGYGYIQSGQKLGVYNDVAAFSVLRFSEKPSFETANEYIASGDYSWNSGMFIWRAQDIWEEFTRQMPELSDSLQRIAQDWHTPQRNRTLQEAWPRLSVQTIDYGIMENAQRVAVIPVDGLDWNDVGSWESLYDVLPKDADGNLLQASQVLAFESRGTLVYAENSSRLFVTIGTQDLIIVDTGDVLMVCPRDQAQKVKQVVAELKKSSPQYI